MIGVITVDKNEDFKSLLKHWTAIVKNELAENLSQYQALLHYCTFRPNVTYQQLAYAYVQSPLQHTLPLRKYLQLMEQALYCYRNTDLKGKMDEYFDNLPKEKQDLPFLSMLSDYILEELQLCNHTHGK